MTSTLETVTSSDGTPIAFERFGDGPPMILIGGACNDRTTVTGLAASLAPDVTAIAYDRRGRGDSGDNGAGDYSVAREIDDIAALIKQLGGSAALFGHSSGAILAIEATLQGLPVNALAVYEPPYIVDDTRPRPRADLGDRLQALIKEDRRDDAVALFMTEAVNVPPQAMEGVRASEMWAWFTRLAHTLPYDTAVCGSGHVLPADRLATITVPTLVMGGGRSEEWMLAATRAVAEVVPDARHLVLDGEDHGVLHNPEALRPVLLEFLP